MFDIATTVIIIICIMCDDQFEMKRSNCKSNLLSQNLLTNSAACSSRLAAKFVCKYCFCGRLPS